MYGVQKVELTPILAKPCLKFSDQASKQLKCFKKYQFANTAHTTAAWPNTEPAQVQWRVCVLQCQSKLQGVQMSYAECVLHHFWVLSHVDVLLHEAWGTGTHPQNHTGISDCMEQKMNTLTLSSPHLNSTSMLILPALLFQIALKNTRRNLSTIHLFWLYAKVWILYIYLPKLGISHWGLLWFYERMRL